MEENLHFLEEKTRIMWCFPPGNVILAKYLAVKMPDNYLHSEITSQVIKAYYNVYNTLGYGFLEKVYQNALMLELLDLNLRCDVQVPIDLYYKEHNVGFYVADIIVNGCVIVEIKASELLSSAHEAQLVNYLKATDIQVGMLLNFGDEPQFKRKIFSTKFKKSSSENDQRKS